MNNNRLILGSGTWHWPGYVTIDANPDMNPDIVAVFPPLPDAITSRRWREIVASHVIEHVYLDEAQTLLTACYNILEDGGVLTLEQPNLDYCCRVILGLIDPPEGRSRFQFGIQGIFGASFTGNRWDGHHWAYSPESLTELLLEAGFKRDKIVQKPARFHEPARDFILEATK